MSMSTTGGRLGNQRGEDRPVRRRLQLGVASVCVGAALTVPLAGVASADGGTGSSSSAGQASSSKVVRAAGKGDNFGAIARLVTSTAKELLNRKTTLNPVQRLDDLTPKHPSLLDLIFKNV